MRHWLQLATRSWSARLGRTSAVVIAVALGVGAVLSVVGIYQSVELSIGAEIVDNWVGRTHISIESPMGHWGSVERALEPEVARIPNIKHTTGRFKSPMRVRIPEGRAGMSPDRYSIDGDLVEVDVIGVEPETEYLFRDHIGLEGRRIESDGHKSLVLERQLAEDLGLAIGDEIQVEPFRDEPTVAFTIIGTFEGKRVALFQRPIAYVALEDVYALGRNDKNVTIIDCIVEDDSAEALEATAEDVRKLLRDRRQGYEVITATAKLNQLRLAQQATRLILMLFACIALLTSFFIIVTTMSMGMIQRVRSLGTMRCLGLTRRQLCGLVFAEMLPLGVLGVLLGLPTGAGLTYAGVAWIPHLDRVVQEVVLTRSAIGWAAVGGIVTTIAAALILLSQTLAVSPLAATTPQARGDRMALVIGAGIAGLLLLLGHQWMVHRLEPLAWMNPVVVLGGMGCLYGGYVLLAPVAVLIIGSGALWIAAPLFGIRRKLARDQVGRALWRSAGVCWMLMVGLSLIVIFAVRGESINHAWDFPSKMAGTFVWTHDPVPREVTQKAATIPAVRQVTPIHEVLCSIAPKQKSILNIFTTRSFFVAGDPDTFLNMAELEFFQGEVEDAREKLERGGYVLLPTEAAHSFGYGLGDKLTIELGSNSCEFEVAGVVRSPAMDIAVSYFQADTYMMIAAASSVLGTLDDLERCFGIDRITMLLMNVDVPTTQPPEAFFADTPLSRDHRQVAANMVAWMDALPQEKQRLDSMREELLAFSSGSAAVVQSAPFREIRRYVHASYMLAEAWEDLEPKARWEIFGENLVLAEVAAIMDRPGAQIGSLRRLKQDIDRGIRRATLIVSAIPLISIIVASIGVANMMMVNVISRSRQIAIMRAVGATKSQIARLVLVEALVLGVLGAVVGVLLGIHAAASENVLTLRLIGFEVPMAIPWPRVAAGLALTLAVCLLAGIAPALRASRSNVIDAMQVT